MKGIQLCQLYEKNSDVKQHVVLLRVSTLSVPGNLREHSFVIVFFLLIPSIIFARLLSSSPSLVATQTRGQLRRGSSPPSPLRYAASFFIVIITQHLLPSPACVEYRSAYPRRQTRSAVGVSGKKNSTYGDLNPNLA